MLIMSQAKLFMSYIIYKITNLINNKIYIGQTVHTLQERWMGHVWDAKNKSYTNRPLLNAILKYGEDNFTIEPVEECYSKEELDAREIYWIDKLNTRDRNIGYNVSKGGDRGAGGPNFKGHHHSEETRKKMSESRKGKLNANYGNRWHRTPDMNYNYKGEHNPMYGKHQSEESKRKSSLSHSGKKAYSNKELDKVIFITEEEGEKLLKSNTGWIRGNIHRRNK